MKKEEIISRFDQLTSEWYGNYGYSEPVVNLDEYVSACKCRMGYVELDHELFGTYIEHTTRSFEVIETGLDIYIKDTPLYEKNTANIWVEAKDIQKWWGGTQRMYAYVISKMFAAFPDAELNEEHSDLANCSFMFTIKVDEE